MVPEISIIVPVYNVCKYLPRCLNSILAQTFHNFEVILVDDGSTDCSGKICDKYANQDNRIKVIHQHNSGVSSARNAALDIAQGKYIGFIDSDDWIAEDFYEILYNTLKTKQGDIAICSFYISQNGKLICNNKKKSIKVFRNSECIEMFLKSEYPFIPSYTWNKLFKAHLFHDLKFDEKLKVLEDEDLIYFLLLKKITVIYIDKPLYFYFFRVNSALHSGFDINKKCNLVTVAKKVVKNTQEYQDKYLKLSYLKYVQTFQKVLIEIIRDDFSKYKKMYDNLSDELNRKYFMLLFNKHISFKQKIHLTIIKISPELYKRYIYYKSGLL